VFGDDKEGSAMDDTTTTQGGDMEKGVDTYIIHQEFINHLYIYIYIYIYINQ